MEKKPQPIQFNNNQERIEKVRKEAEERLKKEKDKLKKK